MTKDSSKRMRSKIRSLKREDMAQLIELIGYHAEYERSPFDPVGKLTILAHDIFEKEKLQCLVVEVDDLLLGYATYTIQYSTWEAAEYLYMDCLFLLESARGEGLGLRLMQELKSIALAKSMKIIQWQTPNFNKGAIRFYKRLGATSLDKERFFWNLLDD